MNYAAGIAPGESTLGGEVDRRLGDVVIRPSRLCVTGPRGEAKVEPKGMVVLLLLADARGETVLRQAIYELVWGGVFVGDDSLNRAIHIARRALRDAGSSATIETVPRIGYRLSGIPEGAEAEDHSSPKAPDTPVASRMPTRRAALTGIAATAAAGLAGWGFYRGSRAREASRLVGEARRLLRSEAPGDARAALARLDEATHLAPHEAAPWGLSAYALSAVEGDPAAAARADIAAGKALAIDPANRDARVARANLQAGLVEWEATEAELRRILAEDKRNVEAMDALGFLLQGVGRSRESWEVLERAAAADPLAAGPQYKRAIKLWIMGRMAESDRVADRALQLWPRHPWVWNARFMTYAFSGRQGAARAMLADRAGHPETIAPPALATWGKGLDALEHPSPATIAAAREAYFAASPRSPGMAVHGIMTLSALGALDGAWAIIDMLVLDRGPLARPAPAVPSRKLLSDASWRKTQWLFTPATTPVRRSQRYAEFTERSGLAAYWRRNGIVPDPVRSLDNA